MRSGWASVWALASVLALSACDDDNGDQGLLTCYELIPGEMVGPDISPTSTNRVIAQASSDLSVAVGTAAIGLASVCASIAVDLGAGSASIDEAFSSPDLDTRASKACTTAVDAIKRDGKTHVTLPATCTRSSALVTACSTQCVPASDDCTVACRVSASASAECPMPPDPQFGPISVIRARVALMAEDIGALAKAESSNVNLKAACTPVNVNFTSRAGNSMTGLLTVADSVLAAAKRP